MNPNDYDLPPLPDEQPRGLDYNDVEAYIFDNPQPVDHAAEVQRLKAEMLELVRQHTLVVQKLRTEVETLNDRLTVRTTALRRTEGQFLILVRTLRALCAHLANQPITSLTYFGGAAFAKSVREANEVLSHCAGIE